MVARSALVDVRPFRTGLAVSAFGLLLTLGAEHGGWVGRELDRLFSALLGDDRRDDRRRDDARGRAAPALPAPRSARSSAARATRCAARAGTRAGSAPGPSPPPRPPSSIVAACRSCTPSSRPSTSSTTTRTSSPRPGRRRSSATTPRQRARSPTRRACSTPLPGHPDYDLPDRSLLRCSPPGSGPSPEAGRRVAEALVQTLANFGVDATVVGQISGPRVTRYELQLAPGTKVAKVAALKDDLSYALATTEIRILAPIPGKQAVGVEVPNLSPNIVTLGDIFDDLPADGEPARGLARQGHLRQRGLDRPRADAAPADRRHDRLGQVGLHQHDPHLDPAPRDPGRGAADPDRPEADRAQLLRVDPAPADAGRLEPEGGRGRARQRRRGDGAPLRAPLRAPRAQPARGEPRPPPARRAAAPVPARRDRRARRPDDDLAAGGRGRGHPARAEVARRRHPPRARDAAAVGGRDHRHDQGERARRGSPSPSRARPTRA